MQSIYLDVFATPKVWESGQIFDCIMLAVDWHRR